MKNQRIRQINSKTSPATNPTVANPRISKRSSFGIARSQIKKATSLKKSPAFLKICAKPQNAGKTIGQDFAHPEYISAPSLHQDPFHCPKGLI